jgi:hypothetical protein
MVFFLYYALMSLSQDGNHPVNPLGRDCIFGKKPVVYLLSIFLSSQELFLIKVTGRLLLTAKTVLWARTLSKPNNQAGFDHDIQNH